MYERTSSIAKEGAARTNTAVRDWNGSTMARLRDFGRRLNLARDGDENEVVPQAELEWYAVTLPALEHARGLSYATLREFPLDRLPLPEGPEGSPGEISGAEVASLTEAAAFSEGTTDAEKERVARAVSGAQLTPWQQRHAQLIMRHVPELRHFHDSIIADLPAFELAFWSAYFFLARHVLPADQTIPLYPRGMEDTSATADAADPAVRPMHAPGQMSVDAGEPRVSRVAEARGGAREEARPGLSGLLAVGSQLKTGLGVAAKEAKEMAGHLKEGLVSIGKDASAAVQGLGANRARRESQDSDELDAMLEEEMAKMRSMQTTGEGGSGDIAAVPRG